MLMSSLVVFLTTFVAFFTLFWAMQLPPPTPISMSAGTQIVLALIDRAAAILTALGLVLTAVVGLYNAVKIRQVKDQSDGHFSELTKALAASVPASSVPTVPTIVVTPSSASSSPGVPGGRRADDGPSAVVVEPLSVPKEPQ